MFVNSFFLHSVGMFTVEDKKLMLCNCFMIITTIILHHKFGVLLSALWIHANPYTSITGERSYYNTLEVFNNSSWRVIQAS